MKIFGNISELIGNTPLLELGGFTKKFGLGARLLVKLEARNPAGSIKDRVALTMLDDAERSGKIDSDTVIIEPTSGNTGIGLAALCAKKGYRLVIVMPDTMSAERRKLMTAYGAELVLTDGKLGMSGAVAEADRLAATYKKSFIAGQFVNPSNPKAHYLTTAPEIWNDTDGKLAAFVAGIGTGGTISGAGKFFKEKNAEIKIIGAEPAESAVIGGHSAGAHGIQGIGAGFVPEVYDGSAVDEILAVPTETAKATARLLAKTDGVLAGISGGCNVAAAAEIARRKEFEGKLIVTVLPDAGDRYLSTDLY